MNIAAVILLAALIYFIFITEYSKPPVPTTTATAGTNMGTAGNSTNTTGAVETALNNVAMGTNKLVTDIINVANANQLNPAILYGIVSAEQGTTNPNEWNAGAYNPNDPTGAYGLTQILGSTAESFNVNPAMLLQSPETALNTTAQYILKYNPTNSNNISVTAGIYNGGPNIFNEIQNGTVSAGTTNAVGAYIEKASAGYNYFNNTYGSSQ